MDITVKTQCECENPCRPQLEPPKWTPPIVPFWGYSDFTPTIPKLYWNVKSQEQRILNLFKLLDKLVCYTNGIGEQVNLNYEEIQELKETLDGILDEDSDFWKLFEKIAYEWIDNNMTKFIEHSIKQVYFGLTENGYFCAYIPESWSEIIFDTGAVYGRSDYGRLILRFDAEGEDVIDNTYSYTMSETDKKKLVADLELAIRRTDSAFKTLFTNLDVEVEKTGGNV